MKRERSCSGLEEGFFLPDLCQAGRVVALMVAAELFAIVLALALPAPSGDRWNELALISLFIQWIALSSAGLLCLLRRPLCRLGNRIAIVSAYLILLGVIALFSELAFHGMRYFSVGLTLAEPDHIDFLLRNFTIGALISAVIMRYFYVQHRLLLQHRAEARARLEALQARIRPHFLFNSLNTVAALTRTHPAEAEEAVHDLADLFRATLREGRSLIALDEELALVRSYLRIEQLRLGERLEVSWSIDGLPEGVQVPLLTLQPLVENAVYHGIEPRTDGGEVVIAARDDGDHLIIEICNPLPEEEADKHEGNQLALDNIKQRIDSIYGEHGHIDVHRDEQRYCVVIRIPHRAGEITE